MGPRRIYSDRLSVCGRSSAAHLAASLALVHSGIARMGQSRQPMVIGRMGMRTAGRRAAPPPWLIMRRHDPCHLLAIARTFGSIAIQPEAGTVARMKTRTVAAAVWLYAGWYAGTLFSDMFGISHLVGIVPSAILAATLAPVSWRVGWDSINHRRGGNRRTSAAI